MEDCPEEIKLTTRDGVSFTVDEKTARVSRTIRGMMEASMESGQERSPILVDCPHTDVLDKVLDWARHHKNDRPYESPRSEDEYSVWDLMYFNVSDNMLLKILVVANYLDMTDLFRQTITMLRHRLRSQTEEQLRRRAGSYGDPGDLFHDTELSKIKKENSIVKVTKH